MYCICIVFVCFGGFDCSATLVLVCGCLISSWLNDFKAFCEESLAVRVHVRRYDGEHIHRA